MSDWMTDTTRKDWTLSPAYPMMLRDRDGNTVLHSSDSAATIPALMEWVSSTGARITHLEVTPANLEDVFLSLTGRQLGVEDEE